MYQSYRKYVVGDLPKRDLSASVTNSVTLGTHVVTIENVWYFEQTVQLDLRTEMGDLFTDLLWICERDNPNKLSWRLWRLLFAICKCDYKKTNSFIDELRKDFNKLDSIVGSKVKALIRDSEGFKINRDMGGQFWLADGPSGSRLDGGPFSSFNEAKTYAQNKGLRQSNLTVGRWDAL